MFRPSTVTVVPFVLLSYFRRGLSQSALTNVIVACIAVDFLLFLRRCVPSKLQGVDCFMKHGAFPVLLFSPVFAVLSELFVPLFLFSASNVYFVYVTIYFIILKYLSLTRLTSVVKLSHFLTNGRFLWGLSAFDKGRCCFPYLVVPMSGVMIFVKYPIKEGL